MENFKLKSKKIKEIESYCNLIYERNRKLNVKDHILDSNRTGKEINLQGLGAEIWYKEKYNIQMLSYEMAEEQTVRQYADAKGLDFDELKTITKGMKQDDIINLLDGLMIRNNKKKEDRNLKS